MKDSNGNVFGDNVSIYRDVVVRNSEIGEKTILADDVFVTNSKIGSYGRIERRALIFNSLLGTCNNVGWNSTVRNCVIGDYSGFSWNVSIGNGDHNIHTLTMRTFPFDKWYGFIYEEEEKSISESGIFDFYSSPVTIGNDVMGGAGCNILRGVNIADGALIGAGAVLTKDVGPYEIWAGVPAKKISQRFSDEIISELLELQWWKWPREVIKNNIHYFQKNVDLALLKELRDQVCADVL